MHKLEKPNKDGKRIVKSSTNGKKDYRPALSLSPDEYKLLKKYCYMKEATMGETLHHIVKEFLDSLVFGDD